METRAFFLLGIDREVGVAVRRDSGDLQPGKEPMRPGSRLPPFRPDGGPTRPEVAALLDFGKELPTAAVSLYQMNTL